VRALWRAKLNLDLGSWREMDSREQVHPAVADVDAQSTTKVVSNSVVDRSNNGDWFSLSPGVCRSHAYLADAVKMRDMSKRGEEEYETVTALKLLTTSFQLG
jgi:hypothetical protein